MTDPSLSYVARSFARTGMTVWRNDDGGRAAAGYKGRTGDCACRSIAIATGLPYQKVYDDLIAYAARERPRGKKKRSHPRTGVHKPTCRRYLADLGWLWVPTMSIGSGCRVHVDAAELPDGRLILQCSRHLTVMIDGVVHDTHDPARDGDRCVYGFWYRPVDQIHIDAWYQNR
jgi:hypothetical protein